MICGSKSVQSLLKRIKCSAEGSNHLERNLRILLDWNRGKKCAKYFFILSTYQEALGKLEAAKISLEMALDRKLPMWSSLQDLNPAQFVAKVRQLDDLTKECLWMREKVILVLQKSTEQNISKSIEHERSPINRRDACELGVEDFLKDYVAKGIPVVITGLQSEVLSSTWNLDLVLSEVRSNNTCVPTIIHSARPTAPSSSNHYFYFKIVCFARI